MAAIVYIAQHNRFPPFTYCNPPTCLYDDLMTDEQQVRYGTENSYAYARRTGGRQRGMAQFLINRGIAADIQSANFLLLAGTVIAVLIMGFLWWRMLRPVNTPPPPEKINVALQLPPLRQ